MSTLVDLAETNFALWAATVSSGLPKEVAKLYSDDFVLLPTMNNAVVCTQEGCEQYFCTFCALAPAAHILEQHVTPLADDCYHHCGVYRFVLEAKDGECVEARFTMIWKQQGQDWKILHHHSSQMLGGHSA